MAREKILAMVLAGGEGTRLSPLTAERSKPAVPFGGRYRIVDFVLSNLVNSGVHAIYLLVQYKSQSLIEHVNRAWTLSPVIPEQFITVVPPQMREGPEWFQGTADAVYQNLNLMDYHDPTLVLVFGADHVYRMDMCAMIDFHRATGAHATVAALPVPVEQSPSFGIIAADADGRVRGFQEKPADPVRMPDRPSHAFASMGNYIFDARRACARSARGERARRERLRPSRAAAHGRNAQGVRVRFLDAIECPACATTKISPTGAMSAPSTPTSTPIRTCSEPSRASICSTRAGWFARAATKVRRRRSSTAPCATACSAPAR